jgi:RHS repeat-associated protein
VYAYDFGSGSPGPLISHTATTYNSLSETISSIPVTISNRPATVSVKDGSGTTQSQTSYFYDQTTPNPTSNIPEHITVTGSRGNLTTLQRLVQGTATIQKTTSYNDTGTVAVDNDFKGNPAATYVYGTNSCGGSYPTTVTDAMGMTQTIVWDCNGGVKTSVKDANNQTTLYKYLDPNYWRLTETDFPDGGQVTTSYNLGTNRPWNIVTNTKLTSTQEFTRTTVYDTLARVSQQQLNSDPESPDLTATTYDSAGHVHSTSNPYRTTTDSTYGLTFYAYDGLGRVTLQTEPDGSSVATSYNSNCTTVTDEAGNLRESCTDGLGRLTEVEEPGPGAQVATVGGGSIAISGGSDQSGTFNMCPNNPNGPCWETIPDSGTIYLTVDGFQVNTGYTLGSSASGIASALVAALNASTSPVTASLNGNTVVMVSRELGAGGDFSWSASVSWISYFTVPSFSPCGGLGSCSGSLSGGVSASLGNSPLITLYQYDILGNMLCVEQHGSATTGTGCSSPPSDDATSPWRVRRFTYDSLSRLLTASNPESGTIAYTYDNNGNALTKVSPKPNQTGTSTITTSYAYDAGNRLTQKSYTGITMPVAKYGYDVVAPLTGCTVAPLPINSPTNLKGRETEMCFGSSTSVWSYDPMGRMAQENTNDINSNNVTSGKSILYSYYLDGEAHTLTYPSGTVVTYTATTAGRTSTVSDPSNTYVSPPSTAPMYSAGGLLVGMKNGSAITTANAYNNRLQPVTLSAGTTAATLMSLSYNFHSGAGDNGLISQIVDNIDSTRSTAFQYDLLNRISQANTINTSGANCWGEVYTIDSWSNLTNRSGPSGMSGCSTEGLSLSATLKNQLVGLTYDAAGNVTNDGNGNAPTYDAENRIITDAGVTYSYDAAGDRMEKSSGTFYWYGAGGAVLAESDLSGNINEEYIFFNGQRLARVDRPSGTVHYYFSDQLGSASVITDASGNIKEQYFYYPFGGTQSSVGSDPNHYKFQGKERDTESGLDNFGARFDSSSLGRFMTPDWAAKPTTVPYAKFGDPQSLNLYAYVENSPINRIDADGHMTSGDFRCVNQRLCVDQAPGGGTCDNEAGNCETGEWSNDYILKVSQQQNIAWSSLSAGQQALVPGGEKAWNALPGRDGMGAAQSNYAAITHALEETTLSNGTTGLSQVKSVTEIGPTGIGVTWNAGAAGAFEASGFASRPGKGHPGESGMIGAPTASGKIQGGFFQAKGVHVLFKDSDKGATGHVHIDYRGLFSGHFGGANDDVRQNYQTYKRWFGSIPGYSP